MRFGVCVEHLRHQVWAESVARPMLICKGLTCSSEAPFMTCSSE